MGAVLVNFAVKDFGRAHASLTWPSTDGVVLGQDIDGDHPKAAIRYAYFVDGHNYQSRRIRFFTARFSGMDMPNYTVGQTVTVFTKPDKPSISVLQQGGSGAVFAVLVLIGWILIFVGLGGVVRTVFVTAREFRPEPLDQEAVFDADS